MKVYIYILNTLADWEIGYLTAELNSGRFLDKTRLPVEIIKIGNTTEPIKTMGGITITPDENIDNIKFEEDDLLILPGADTWTEEENKKIIDIVSSIIDEKVIIAAVCGATIALANKGILNNRKHTSNDLEFLKMFCPEYTGENFYINQPAVTDDNLITASGIAPLEFSYEVLKRTNLMKTETLEAWYQLYKTNDSKYFHALMESIEGA
ncbi:type 1 glutamine amidotransferase family protein [Methanobacterium formicicum]|jgi:putative intracellular protease/amidase|uniref:Glutamine amidotransferase n=1 Tax=Methanobacterium formicicum TaxID=2162 RepID=A0A0S4FMW9_METFO|nr:type 1 glutamine amidotransferase family protein [Methanobacterium formicicum]MBF4474193.1 glutamine amidotransferase [Methanobacterium formicicum]CEL24390.1 putative protease YoaZ [Methanobacterium formicicum]